MTITEKIIEAKNLEEMDALRIEVIAKMKPAILKQWRDKYWIMKKRPACGRVK